MIMNYVQLEALGFRVVRIDKISGLSGFAAIIGVFPPAGWRWMMTPSG